MSDEPLKDESQDDGPQPDRIPAFEATAPGIAEEPAYLKDSVAGTVEIDIPLGLELATETEAPSQLELFSPVGARSEELSDYGEPSLGTETFSPLPREHPVSRTPNFADALFFLALLLLGLLVTTGTLGLALHFHWFGLRNFEEAAKSTQIALGTQLLIYAIALAGAVPLFRAVWSKGYFAGLHWHAATAYRLRYRLVGTAFLCNLLAMAGNWLLPFPEHAPIDKMFNTSTDAWMLACFGVTLAPFFEEMIFRGFLLPAMATAWDWCGERVFHARAGLGLRPLDAQGNPVWSTAAMIFASLTVSAPFALMHSAQVGQAWGPLLLLYCVSLILCTVRLATRSLAASTVVHSAYNLMLFAVMFAQTDGFRHMEKM